MALQRFFPLKDFYLNCDDSSGFEAVLGVGGVPVEGVQLGVGVVGELPSRNALKVYFQVVQLKPDAHHPGVGGNLGSQARHLVRHHVHTALLLLW